MEWLIAEKVLTYESLGWGVAFMLLLGLFGMQFRAWRFRKEQEGLRQELQSLHQSNSSNVPIQSQQQSTRL